MNNKNSSYYQNFIIPLKSLHNTESMGTQEIEEQQGIIKLRMRIFFSGVIIQ